MFRNRVSVALVTLVVCSAWISGCGKKGFSIVRNANVVASTVNSEAHVRLDADLDTKSIVLFAIELPIMNASHPGKQYGTVALRPNAGGGGQLSVDVNLTQAINDRVVGDARLPNGNLIPIGTGSAEVFSFDVGSSKSKVYLAVAPGVAVIGSALAIKELEGLGQAIGGVDLFPQFTMGKVRGVAGVFTGTGAGQSGLGVFADFGDVLKGNTTPQVLAFARMPSAEASALTRVTEVPNQVKVRAVKPSKSKEDKINAYLMKLNSKRAKVHFSN